MTNEEPSADDGRRAERRRALNARLEHRMSTRFASRRPRRALAVAGAACLGLFWVDAAVSWALAPSDTAMIVNFVIIGVVAVAVAILGGMLLAATGGMIARRTDELDEREAAARLRASSTAHRCTSLVLFLLALVSMFAIGRDGRAAQVPGAALFLIAVALLLTHVLLPFVVTTWQLPDPPPEDEDSATGYGRSAAVS